MHVNPTAHNPRRTSGVKLALLRAIFSRFGRCSTATRLRWGRVLAWLAVRLMRSRAHIVRTNLRLCFPDLDARAREVLLRRHFHLLAQSLVDRGLCWFGTPERILDTIRIQGLEHLETLLAQQCRILMLVPHFIGLDAAGTRLSLFLQELATLYTRQSDPEVDRLVREGRARFHRVHLISRHDGVRGLIRHLRAGVPVYYLPDMDFGKKGAAFVPFFNIPAATLLATAQIARTQNAAVVPVISRLDLTTGRYHVQVLPALEDFPGGQDNVQATARMNRLIETWIRPDPAQYYWVHRRFKTRPPGETSPYQRTLPRPPAAEGATNWRFAKMHGNGNDFVVLDGVRQRIQLHADLVRALANRRFGIGADQILLVEPATHPEADFRYRIFNADGGEVEHCGNGARCFARFVFEQGLSQRKTLRAEISTGLITLTLDENGEVDVDMGAVRFDPLALAFDAQHLSSRQQGQATLWSLPLADGTVVECALVAISNPHAVLLVDAVVNAPVDTLGPAITHHPRFAHQVNTGFLQVVDAHTAKLRVFERGAGETLSCGTGACAAAITGIRLGLLQSPVRVQTRGGWLTIAWDGSRLHMRGPSVTVFQGEIAPATLALPPDFQDPI